MHCVQLRFLTSNYSKDFRGGGGIPVLPPPPPPPKNPERYLGIDRALQSPIKSLRDWLLTQKETHTPLPHSDTDTDVHTNTLFTFTQYQSPVGPQDAITPDHH